MLLSEIKWQPFNEFYESADLKHENGSEYGLDRAVDNHNEISLWHKLDFLDVVANDVFTVACHLVNMTQMEPR